MSVTFVGECEQSLAGNVAQLLLLEWTVSFVTLCFLCCCVSVVVVYVRQMSLALFGSTGNVQFIRAHTQDKLTSRIDHLADKLRSQYSRCAGQLFDFSFSRTRTHARTHTFSRRPFYLNLG